MSDVEELILAEIKRDKVVELALAMGYVACLKACPRAPSGLHGSVIPSRSALM